MRPRSKKAIKVQLPEPDYKALYEQSQADLLLCTQLLQSKSEHYTIANAHADAVTKELLSRMAKSN